MIRGEIMMNNNLDINFNSTVSLNSINYNSNQHRESFSYELDKIHPKMLQRDRVVMMVMKVLVAMMVMMMIPMKPSSMTVTMAMISLLREGISLTDFCLPAFSLCVFSAPQRWQSLSANLSSVLGFWGDDIREGAMAEVGQGGHTTRRRGLGLARAMRWCGPLVAHLALSFWLPPSSSEIGTSKYFPRIAGLQKYCILMVLFPAES
jgi:hypothetical protein